MKRTIIVLITASGLCGATQAEEYRRCASQGSSHATGYSALVSQQSREEGAAREENGANDPALRAALEKERKRAIIIIEEALKKARERARREAEEARQKRVAEVKPHPDTKKETRKKQAAHEPPRTGSSATREKSAERSATVE